MGSIAMIANSLVLVIAASGSTLLEELAVLGYTESPIPVGETLSAANHADEVYVSEEEGRLVVFTEEQWEEQTKPVWQQLPEDVWEILLENKIAFPSAYYLDSPTILIGTDAGEWGGGLVAINTQGNVRRILGENVTAIQEIDNRVFVITGLGHMGISEGAVHEVVHYKNRRPRMERLTLLPGPPLLVVKKKGEHFVSDSQVLIVGYDYIVELDIGDKDFGPSLSVHASNTFWRNLYPKSAVVRDNTMVLGMRSGIAHITMPYTLPTSQAEIRYFTKKVE